MTPKSMILLVLAGVLANNYALEKFLGLAPFLGQASRGRKALGLGLAVTLVTVLTAAAAWPLQQLVLAPLGLGYLQTLAFAAVVLLAVGLVQLCAGRLGRSLGLYFPLIALNSAVLGAAVNTAGAASLAEALLSALGVGLGFLAALLLMGGVLSRLDEQYVPKAFRGLPIRVLAAAILSMALVAFQ